MKEHTTASKTVFSGRVVRLDVLDVELDNGVASTREIVRHRGATAILPRLPDGQFVFVRQFRKAFERDFLEVVAGLLEPGEDPDECARRELLEETGCRALSLVSLGALCASPGYTTERVRVYFSDVAEPEKDLQLDEDEHVEVVIMSENEVNEAIKSGEIEDSKTLAMWLLYQTKIKKQGVRS